MGGQMANEVQTKSQAESLEKVLVQGDLNALSSEQRVLYYKTVCDSLGLNYLTRPFDYIVLNDKLTLYAKRDATDQLRKLHSVSIEITKTELLNGVYIVTARATDKTGRVDTSTGAVSLTGKRWNKTKNQYDEWSLKGDELANAYMKAETKAKRRVTMSICGLGFLDETEIETIVKDVPHSETKTQKVLPAAKVTETTDVKEGLKTVASDLKIIQDVAKECKYTPDEVIELMQNQFNKRRVSELTKPEFNQLINHMRGGNGITVSAKSEMQRLSEEQPTTLFGD